MASSLLAALGGLRAHQGWIDIIGNNLANANTPGYKASRTVFSDLIHQNIRSAQPPTANVGGTNPIQVGLGVVIGHTDRNHVQGPLNLTGRSLDLALVGNGFFSLSNGSSTVFSRVGTFGLDGEKNVVDVRTGYRVLAANGQPLEIDVDGVQPPSATSRIQFAGNLPAEVTGPLEQVLSTSSTLREGTEATLTGTTAGDLTGLDPDEAYTLELVANGGVPTTISVTSDGTGTIQQSDLVDAINDANIGVTASVAGGFVALTSSVTGDSSTIKVNPGSGNDLAAAAGFSTQQVKGTETDATGATSLNALVTNSADYVDGDAIEITGTDTDGSPIAATFTFGAGNDGTTIDDLVAFVDALYPGATAEFNGSTGEIELTADETGESQLSLSIDDGTGATGSTNWSLNAFAVDQNGAGPDTVTTSTEVFDPAGLAHVVTFRYERQDDGSWTLFTEMDPDEGTVLTPQVDGISFGLDGSLQTFPGGPLQVQFNGQAAQDVDVSFGSPGSIDGLTQFGGTSSVAIESQDGAPVGELSSISVDPRGVVVGFYTNGETAELGQFGIATFANEYGLEAAGDNYFTETPNSGQRVLSGGLENGAGEVVGGALEESNVDTAEEFVRLIQAQRGFQANARIITVQDEMFAEIVRII